MTSPWNGPRYRSWASDTAIFAVVFIIVLIITAVTDYLNGPADPPAYLLAACGAASAALFGAVSSDKGKREREVSDTATRAEAKADDALGRSESSTNEAFNRVLDVQRRELAANRAALQLMRDAVTVKEDAGLPVLPETMDSITQLEKQISQLAAEIRTRQQSADAQSIVTSASRQSTHDTAVRAEAKADDALARADTSLQRADVAHERADVSEDRADASEVRESGWSQHRDHADNDPDTVHPPHTEGGP